MPEQIPVSTAQAQLAADQHAMQMLFDETARIDVLNAQAEAARSVRVQMCAYLLDAGLSAAGPQPGSCA